MPGQFIPDPEWVMLGITQPEGVCVLASKTLTIAELKAALNHVIRDGRNRFENAWELAVTMDDVYWATGDDYADAIRRLFDLWQPDADSAELAARCPTPPALHALPAASRELTP